MERSTRLAGRIAVVTGGLRGIGEGTAIALAQAGAHVVVFDLDADDAQPVQSLRDRILQCGVRFAYRRTDVTHSTQVDASFAACAAEIGPPSILVNNAGKSMPPAPIDISAERDWDAQIALNLKAAYLCTRAAVAHFKKSGAGVVVNIASTAGRGLSEASSVAYASAKAGIVGFTRQVARELGPFGIRVNAIAPGSIMTGRAAERFENGTQESRDRTLSTIPLRRMGRPEDVGNVVVFLASDAAAFMTGAILDVNGGRSMV
jgi:3-oxoacyl-[acyl-carrier protein] reductase